MNGQFMFGMLVPVVINLLLILGLGVMLVYGFILLVRFLRAGTKAFNIYIEKSTGLQSVVRSNNDIRNNNGSNSGNNAVNNGNQSSDNINSPTGNNNEQE